MGAYKFRVDRVVFIVDADSFPDALLAFAKQAGPELGDFEDGPIFIDTITDNSVIRAEDD